MTKHVSPLYTKYRNYINPNSAVEEYTRYPYCPFHKERTSGFISTRTDSGYFLYCFNCKKSMFIPSPGLTVKQTKKKLSTLKREKKNLVVDQVWLPYDFTLDIPMSGMMWLRRYRVTNDEIRRYRFGYSPQRDRLIMPVFTGLGLQYWTGRILTNIPASDKKTPKYTNVSVNRDGTYFFTHNESKHNGTYVLVEDIISAIACERASFRGCALLGSFVDDVLIKRLREEHDDCKQVVIWLDPDKRKEALKYAKRCNALGLKATVLLTPRKDPKDYSKHEIEDMLRKYVTDDNEPDN